MTVAITGAFSYTGKYVTQILIDKGIQVRTLTGHPDNPDPFGGKVAASKLDFNDPAGLRRSLEGVDTFICTYWIRFGHGDMTYEKAVDNTKLLFDAARDAGVKRVVYVSITNADENSPLPYFNGKGRIEKYLKVMGMEYAILRPTTLYGGKGILLNNIAWMLRTFPVFPVPGDGKYKIQPILVDDFARLIADAALAKGNSVYDAAGPEIFTFDEMVKLIGEKIGKKRPLLHLPAGLAWLGSSVVGIFVGDVILTWDEVKGLSANTLVSKETPRGTTHLADWLDANKNEVGIKYFNELKRHY